MPFTNTGHWLGDPPSALGRASDRMMLVTTRWVPSPICCNDGLGAIEYRCKGSTDTGSPSHWAVGYMPLSENDFKSIPLYSTLCSN